jgi:hypothetical protein
MSPERILPNKIEPGRETLACLIIDDPLLRPRYGCIDYTKLLQEMKEHRFFTEIAFIPWNYRRSDLKTIRLFADNADHYAICVHGCNHLGNEFGGTDYQHLSSLASTALWRMEQHKKLTGLPYDPVIVFPKGRFSSVAMKALKDQGYFAAFNSTLLATDVKEMPTIESNQPAARIYHNFPLFLRRYPRDKSHFVQDIAFGRPIIIVEHHGAFRNGYKAITDVVDWINGLGNIKWKSLSDIAEYYLGNKAVTTRQNAKSSPSSFSFNTKVALRRVLSEARDNHVETNNLLANIYKMLRR